MTLVKPNSATGLRDTAATWERRATPPQKVVPDPRNLRAASGTASSNFPQDR